MRFWDASAVVPLLIREGTHAPMMRLLAQDPVLIVWWGTPTECASALARSEREGRLGDSAVVQAFARLATLCADWTEIAPSNSVRDIAQRILRTHPLRAADSLQLAAAIIAAEQEPRSLEFVTLDKELAQAAAREGFPLVASSRPTT